MGGGRGSLVVAAFGGRNGERRDRHPQALEGEQLLIL